MDTYFPTYPKPKQDPLHGWKVVATLFSCRRGHEALVLQDGFMDVAQHVVTTGDGCLHSLPVFGGIPPASCATTRLQSN